MLRFCATTHLVCVLVWCFEDTSLACTTSFQLATGRRARGINTQTASWWLSQRRVSKKRCRQSCTDTFFFSTLSLSHSLSLRWWWCCWGLGLAPVSGSIDLDELTGAPHPSPAHCCDSRGVSTSEELRDADALGGWPWSLRFQRFPNLDAILKQLRGDG